ncbi:alpha/beta hydrolase [Thalassomonas viridans]|uniref:Alpha/beta hydrolase n=1 Tax=Thalassomonas viridans TaxID=137584 RepID=A0AAE9Z8V7_9GAMM|nr:alpha/beta hydrolase-fold protein [Thalassomonas viridans]WDE08841.1 alpha/beta hydrolase [Thalassomonas viridans]
MKAIFCLLMLALFQNTALAVEVIKKEEISVGTKVTIASKQLQEDRKLRIYTPGNFDRSRQYQVIYLFDAEYLFTSTIGIVESLVNSHKIPPSIVVGIETTVRVRDYLPPINGEAKSRHQRWTKKKFLRFGGTENFTAFLTSELFPYIEQHYPVLPNRTLIGYSNAGVFGLHTLVNSPDIFTNYLLISPAAWWGNSEIDEHIARFSQSHQDYSGNLFLTVAGEGRGMYSNALRIASQLEAVAPKSFNWTFKQFESETHQSTVYPSIFQGLVTLFEDINFKVSDDIGKYASVEDVQSYYSRLSTRYKFAVSIPEIVFSDLADAQFAHNRSNEAINTLRLFASTYPKSSFSHSSLASGYMRTKQYANAKLNFEQALKLAKQKGVDDFTVIDYLEDMVANAQSKL